MTLPNKFLKDYRRMFRLLDRGGTFVAFDTETTGLNAEECRIIEIGAVKFDRNGVIEKFGTLVDPQTPIPQRITQITNITDSMVHGRPLIGAVLKDFITFIGESILVAHNAQFDLRFLKAECERSGLPAVSNQVVDTLQFSRWTFPELGGYRQTRMAQVLGVKVLSAHRAYDDAEVCGNIFLNLIKASAERQKP